MRSIASRFSRLLLMTTAVLLMPLSLWGQIKVFPDQISVNDPAVFVIEADRLADAGVDWSLTFLGYSDPELSDEEGPTAEELKIPQTTDEVSKLFPDIGRYLVKATVRKPNDVLKSYTTQVVVYEKRPTVGTVVEFGTAEANEEVAETTGAGDPLEDDSPLGIIGNVLVKEADAKSELGLTELVVELMLSDKTLVDELDQEFLKSCEVVADVYRSKADEFGDITYTEFQKQPAKKAKVIRIMEETSEALQDALDELHPDWQLYFDDYGEETRAELAWIAYQDRLVNELNVAIPKKPQEYRDRFKFRDAWNELAAGFELAKETKEEFFTKYQRILDNYHRNYGDPSWHGPGIYTGPRCPLLILLGI